MTTGIGAVAHYNLLERIGEGGLGEVYRARDTRSGRTIALKLAAPGIATGRRYERLMEDARAAAALSHPNIATLFEVGEHEGRLFLAYEFVQGNTLRRLMAGGPMNAVHALDLAAHVADALAEGHAHGVLHKDIRPDTIVETAKGSAKLLDFGLALWTKAGQTRALAAAAPEGLRPDSLSVVAYMSPEQALGGRLDVRTDLFSLGVTLYEMLTGMNPFAAADASTTVVNVVQKSAPPPSRVNPDLPRAVDAVVERLLAKDMDRRTASASKLAADLRRCRALLDGASGPDAAGHASRADEPAELLPLHEERGGGALWWLLVLLVVAFGTILYFWLR